MEKHYWVYILTDKAYGTLYLGVTNNLSRRMWEHKEGIISGFTKKYKLKKLIYYEQYSDVKEAIAREKALKKWNRDWKIQKIEQVNPTWDDLYSHIQ